MKEAKFEILFNNMFKKYIHGSIIQDVSIKQRKKDNKGLKRMLYTYIYSKGRGRGVGKRGGGMERGIADV